MISIKDQLKTLGLEELIPDVDSKEDWISTLPPKRRILRLLEIAATKYPAQADNIMLLHRDIVQGNAA